MIPEGGCHHRASRRTVPDDAVIMDMRSRDPKDIVCPGCGRLGGLLYIGSVYEKGMYTDVYECFGTVDRDLTCGQGVYDPHRDDDVLWVSPNGHWAVVSDYITDIGTVNVLVMNEGSLTSRYTLYPDGTLLRDDSDIPKYVDRAAREILESMSEECSVLLRGAGP